MELFNLSIAILLGAFGFALVLYLVWALLRPLTLLVRGQKESSKFRRAVERLERVDALVGQRKYPDALKVLRRAVVLDVLDKPRLIEPVKELHQSVLTRCLVIAEELGVRAEKIAEVERLFMERTELQALYMRANESFQSLKSRRERAGKDIPSWSKSDFEERVGEIRRELDENQKVLNKALNVLFESLENSQPESSIVYH